MFKMRCGIPNAFILDISMYKMHVLLYSYCTVRLLISKTLTGTYHSQYNPPARQFPSFPLGCLTLEHVADRLDRNVGKERRSAMRKIPEESRRCFPTQRKPEIADWAGRMLNKMYCCAIVGTVCGYWHTDCWYCVWLVTHGLLVLCVATGTQIVGTVCGYWHTDCWYCVWLLAHELLVLCVATGTQTVGTVCGYWHTDCCHCSFWIEKDQGSPLCSAPMCLVQDRVVCSTIWTVAQERYLFKYTSASHCS